MPLVSLGALPGSQLHIGLAAAYQPLALKLGELTGIAANAQQTLELAFNPSIDPGAFAANFNIPDLELPNVDIGGQYAIDIQKLRLQLGSLELMFSEFDAALGVGGIQVWGYEGAAGQFAPALSKATREGFSDVGPTNFVYGLVLASSSSTEWATLSGALTTGYGSYSGTTADEHGDPKGELRDLGFLPGHALLTGLELAQFGIGLQTEDILAQIARTLADSVIAAGATASTNLISITNAILSALLNPLSLNASVPNASLGLSADIGLEVVVAAGLANVLGPIVASIETTLGGSGVQAWRYHGQLQGLGAEFSSVASRGIAGGGPKDRAHGLVLASSSPADWSALSRVLKTQ